MPPHGPQSRKQGEEVQCCGGNPATGETVYGELLKHQPLPSEVVGPPLRCEPPLWIPQFCDASPTSRTSTATGGNGPGPIDLRIRPCEVEPLERSEILRKIAGLPNSFPRTMSRSPLANAAPCPSLFIVMLGTAATSKLYAHRRVTSGAFNQGHVPTERVTVVPHPVFQQGKVQRTEHMHEQVSGRKRSDPSVGEPCFIGRRCDEALWRVLCVFSGFEFSDWRSLSRSLLYDLFARAAKACVFRGFTTSK